VEILVTPPVEGLEGLQWKLGDLALTVEVHYGSKDLEKYARDIDVPYGTLMNYRLVARAYQTSHRREVSFTHHQIVAPLEDRLEWVGKRRRAAGRNVSLSARWEYPLFLGRSR